MQWQWRPAVMMQWQWLVLAASLGAAAAGGATVAKTKPHLIFVMADDQGHKNGYLNPELITPHTHEVVAEGVRFLNHYVFKFCSPTRSSFLSGRLPIHVNMENSATEQPRAGVEANFTMVSEVLSAHGYKCAHVGKWHVGQASNLHVPKGRGFGQALSFFNFGEDHYTQVRGGSGLQMSAPMRAAQGYDSPDDPGACPQAVDLWGLDGPCQLNGTYGGYIFTEEVVRVVEQHDKSSPLFMYIAFQNIHPPLQVPQQFIDMQHSPELRTTVNGMITFLDQSLGNLSAVLKREEMWANTLLVYSPDNGGYLNNGGDDTPLRGGKFSDFQGGVKVAAFASGGLIPAAMRGTNVSGYIHICDWYRTFSLLANVPEVAIVDQRAAAADLPPLDSLNVWPLLSGANTTSPRTEIPLSTLPGLNGGWRGLALEANLEPGSFRDPNYFSGGEGLIVGEWKIVTGWQPIGPFGSGTAPSCDNKTAMQNDGVGWGKEGGTPPPGTQWDVRQGTCQNKANRISHLPKMLSITQCEVACGAVPSCLQFQYATDGQWCELFNTSTSPHQSSDAKFSCGCRGACPKSPKGWGRYGVNCDCGAGCLFHLPSDPNEVNDLAASNPSRLAQMQKRLAEIRDTTYAPSRGALDPAACVANVKAGGYWSPWLTLHH